MIKYHHAAIEAVMKMWAEKKKKKKNQRLNIMKKNWGFLSRNLAVVKGFKHRNYWQRCTRKSVDVSMYAIRITVDKWEKV